MSEQRSDAMFGRPEAYGIVFVEPTEPTVREVRVKGRVTVEYWVDDTIEANSTMSDQEIKEMAIENLGITGGDVERADLRIEDEAQRISARAIRKQHEQELALLAAWNRGEPIR